MAPTESKFAADTTVSIGQSRNEIERLLTRYGATSFMYGTENNIAAIAFDMKNRRIRLLLRYPDRQSREFTRTPTGRPRSANQAQEAYEQELRRLWRGLVLILKAKLEAIASGIATFETEFGSYILLPDGRTVGEWLEPQLAQIYESGQMPPLLPGVNHSRREIVRVQEVE